MSEQDQTQPKGLFRPAQSRYLKKKWELDYAPSTLAKLASIGTGPRYRMIGGRAVSTPEELDRWAQTRLGIEAATAAEHKAAKANNFREEY